MASWARRLVGPSWTDTTTALYLELHLECAAPNLAFERAPLERVHIGARHAGVHRLDFVGRAGCSDRVHEAEVRACVHLAAGNEYPLRAGAAAVSCRCAAR